MARRVLLIGVGGLGCPAALALAEAGVSHLTLVDPDRVEVSNLHRQLWFSDADVGRPKAEVGAERLRARFSGLEVAGRVDRVDAQNIERLMRAHDVAIDGTDGVDLKFLFSDAALACGTPLVHGGVLRSEGLAMRIERGGPCLRCLFEHPPSADSAPTCAQAGVLGPAAGWVGALQAKLALSPEETGWLYRVDGRALQVRRVRVTPSPDCPVCAEVSA